jgi:monoamine oxidase
MKGMSRAEVLRCALDSLGRITGMAAEAELEGFYFHDWQADAFALGAYSWVPAGGLEARRQLAVPVMDTLYFAGEATDQTGHSATVHGAIASGERVGREILG